MLTKSIKTKLEFNKKARNHVEATGGGGAIKKDK